jgi:hypothetical protein
MCAIDHACSRREVINSLNRSDPYVLWKSLMSPYLTLPYHQHDNSAIMRLVEE